MSSKTTRTSSEKTPSQIRRQAETRVSGPAVADPGLIVSGGEPRLAPRTTRGVEHLGRASPGPISGAKVAFVGIDRVGLAIAGLGHARRQYQYDLRGSRRRGRNASDRFFAALLLARQALGEVDLRRGAVASSPRPVETTQSSSPPGVP